MLTTMQVLQYMRTDVRVAGMDVLAVVLGDVASSSLQFSVSQIRAAIRRGKMGQTQVTKDFLIPGSTDTRVHREGNSKRCRCDAITLDKLDADIITRLKDGKSDS